MGFMDGMISQITQAGQSTVQKAKDISDVAKLNNAISETESRIVGLYERIGYNVYCAYKNDPLPEVAEQIQQVTDLHQQIENCKAQIKAINAANLCPSCGAKIKSGAVYCSECGCKLSMQEASSASGQVTYCSVCGSPLEADVNFCLECGKKIEH